MDIGSSYLPGEISAAFLFAQLQDGLEITRRRMQKWEHYYSFFSELNSSVIGVPMHVPEIAKHNAHMFYLVCPNLSRRSEFIDYMSTHGIDCIFIMCLFMRQLQEYVLGQYAVLWRIL